MKIAIGIGLWICITIYIVIGLAISICNESKWKGKKYEIPIKLFYLFCWPLIVVLFPFWLVYRYIAVSAENRRIRKNFIQ